MAVPQHLRGLEETRAVEEDEGASVQRVPWAVGRTRKASVWSLQGSVLHGSEQRCWREGILFQGPWESRSHILENHVLHR